MPGLVYRDDSINMILVIELIYNLTYMLLNICVFKLLQNILYDNIIT